MCKALQIGLLTAVFNEMGEYKIILSLLAKMGGVHSPEPRQNEKRKSRESGFQRSGVTFRAHCPGVLLK
jgi:hypothetical protein